MEDRLSERVYKNKMVSVKGRIRDIENDMESLPHLKKVSELSYEDWVKWENGEIEL